MKTQEDSKLLSVSEFAEALRLSDKTVYSWIKSGRIEVIKLGRIIRVPYPELAKLQSEGFAQ